MKSWIPSTTDGRPRKGVEQLEKSDQRWMRDAQWVYLNSKEVHYIMSAHARRIVLGHFANGFCRSCRVEEEEETVTHPLGTCPALCQRRNCDCGLNDSIPISWMDSHLYLRTYLTSFSRKPDDICVQRTKCLWKHQKPYYLQNQCRAVLLVKHLK